MQFFGLYLVEVRIPYRVDSFFSARFTLRPEFDPEDGAEGVLEPDSDSGSEFETSLGLKRMLSTRPG